MDLPKLFDDGLEYFGIAARNADRALGDAVGRTLLTIPENTRQDVTPDTFHWLKVSGCVHCRMARKKVFPSVENVHLYIVYF